MRESVRVSEYRSNGTSPGSITRYSVTPLFCYSVKVLPAHAETLQEALNVIQAGGVVAHPTETCYGFACDLTNPEAVRKLFAVKKRPDSLSVSALFASVEQAKEYVEWNEKAEELSKKYLPGPLTVVLPLRTGKGAKYHLSINGTTAATTIGTRVSSHPVAQRLAKLCSVPLSTTSANLHGKPEPYSVEDIVQQFSEQELQPDLILDGGVLPHTPPSTIVEVRKGKLVILRQGAVVL